jgi:dephospho-CoA kinase
MDREHFSEEKYIIGLTGNIATGKSAIMKMAAEKSALTIDADKVVHEILDTDMAIQSAIARAFGPSVRRPDGRINRSALGDIVFNDAEALRNLERIIHPAVQRAVLSHIQASTASVVMIEAIKLLEGKLRTICSTIWVTHCSRDKQLARLQVCRGLDEATALARMDAQAPQENKVRQADIVIDTGGLMEETEAQFLRAWSQIPHMQ